MKGASSRSRISSPVVPASPSMKIVWVNSGSCYPRLMTRSDFMLSAQRALLGFITPNVRSVSGALDGQSITIRYIIDGEVDEDTRDELSCASTVVVADIGPADYHLRFEEEFIRLDAPATLRGEMLPLQFFERHERRPPVE